MTAGVAIRAYGRPITQGSKKRANWGGFVDDNDKTLRPWRKIVRLAAEEAIRYHDTITGPVFVRITFTMGRPKGHYRTGRNAHLLRDAAPRFPVLRGRHGGDLDKLVRACLDAVTTAKVWTDDALVVDMRARKVWAGEHDLALDKPGVHIEVIPLEQEAVPA